MRWLAQERRHLRRSNPGWCAVCRLPTMFVMLGSWARDEYLCARCHSIPRHRALMRVLDSTYPDWPDRRIHELAPGGPASTALAARCRHYSASQYWADVPLGSSRGGVRCEDVEQLTFPDESLDVVVSQDVFEHVLRPDVGFRELARVLRPGGAHVFTVPLYPRPETVVRAVAGDDGEVVHLAPPDYHGNPADPGGSLVVREWGADIADAVHDATGLSTQVVQPGDSRRYGLAGEFLAVFVTRKP